VTKTYRYHTSIFKSVQKEAIPFPAVFQYSYTVFHFIFLNGNILLRVARILIETCGGYIR
jgi:hypothetical protein